MFAQQQTKRFPLLVAQRGALILRITSIVAVGSYTTLAGFLITEFVKEIGWGVDTVGPGIAINMLCYFQFWARA